MSVKVAVRVRPFNKREEERGSKCCIEMNGQTTIIHNMVEEESKPFSFDFSFWSHDQFDTLPDGTMKARNSKYADQQIVYNALGKQVLDNAWEGYHCCLFAYGQTGSGKSYSMIGYDTNKGIVPITCNEIFERISKQTTQNCQFEVSFSILEIYNERVQDLMIVANKRPNQGLKVREHKTLGIYVQDLSKHPVDSYEAIEAKMDEGYRNRSVGATLMNATSSRAHTIITIEFKQILQEGDRRTEKFSVINLVDLAGSEKSGQTGATGDQLKEGCAINKSLTVLGQCISILADKAAGKQKGTVVPYRDSALTRILQNALGGNSKTIMICALSPASINYEETLGTLRYADRAKKIQNKAVVNESPQERMIRELKEENEKLKKILLSAANGGTINIKDLGLGELSDIMETLDENAKAVEDMSKPWDQKLQEEKERTGQTEYVREEDRRIPHLTNLNEDPQLTGKVFYSLVDCPVYVGRKNGDPTPQIILGGIGIRVNHAFFQQKDDGFIYLKSSDDEALENILVNGKKLTEDKDTGVCEQRLHHLDRILFGTNTILLFKYPLLRQKFDKIKERIKSKHSGKISEEELLQLAHIELDKIVELFPPNNDEENEESKESCPMRADDYTKEEIDEDLSAIDWEFAYEEVLKIEEKKKDKLQAEAHRKMAEEKKKIEDALTIKYKKEKQKEMEEQEKKLKVLEDQMKEMEDQRKNQNEEDQQRLSEEAAKEKEISKQLQKQMETQQETLRLQMYQKEQELKLMREEMHQRQEQARHELEEREKELQLKQREQEQKKLKKDAFRQKLRDIQRLLAEANECSKALKKDIVFSYQLIGVIPESFSLNNQPLEDLKNRKEEIQIKVEDHENNLCYIWSTEKFNNKLMMMRDVVNTYQETGEEPELDPNDDPFSDVAQPLLIGQGYYKLEPLAYLIDNPARISIIGTTSSVNGKLEVNIMPIDQNGEDEFPEDMIPDSPHELVGQRIDFIVNIVRAYDLPINFCKDVFIEYNFYLDNEKYETVKIPGKSQDPIFDYRYHHTVEFCSETFIDYLLKDSICFKLYGYPDLQEKENALSKKKKEKASHSKNNTTAKSSQPGGNDSTLSGGGGASFDNTLGSNNTSQNNAIKNQFVVIDDKNYMDKFLVGNDSNQLARDMQRSNTHKQPTVKEMDSFEREYQKQQRSKYDDDKPQSSNTNKKSSKKHKGEKGDKDKDCSIF